MSNMFAFAESRGGALRRVAFEAVSAARALADASGGGDVHALLAGAPGIASLATELGKYGADVVIVVEHAGLANANAESLAATAAERIRAGGYRAAIFSSSAQGRDLAPRVAAKLGQSMAADVTSLELAGDALVATHPAYAGKVIATLKLTGSPAIVTLRPGARAAVETPRAARVESAQPTADPGASKVVVKEMIAGGGTKLDIGDAPVIVSGGRGLKSAENFKLVEDLAAAFGNAAVGATRAVTDDGWRPHSDQIGQTGRQVSPDLYVACGISGAIQHIAGMRNSRTIVAINKDKEAPIFKVADYGIVGDVIEILPVLTAAVKEARAKG
ncbi:MAG TPA: electron transfer flavoprotein subunit alpha/FixB family protein [Gemmatimonadaceae bacterium]|nr:electron transfer flavoprotein subunit alpha/FixB family protein [Gemmatimonadaceae bacterium]